LSSKAVTGTYYVCLDCGTEFAYNWERMAVVDAQPSGVKAFLFRDGKLKRKAS